MVDNSQVSVHGQIYLRQDPVTIRRLLQDRHTQGYQNEDEDHGAMVTHAQMLIETDFSMFRGFEQLQPTNSGRSVPPSLRKPSNFPDSSDSYKSRPKVSTSHGKPS
ncbi:hypothetical protein FKW77_000174 [Venturia effusa]|uniref:Uncharacterized protein n=1 Tax=Venturia effusa TaxID=50376 RepID=A0A517L2J7_9PEZI|nr:hypothetical protein FKW77_000174 [Venturia effusa]